jgi:glutamate-1-semialdehyde 2,1-aminomutase
MRVSKSKVLLDRMTQIVPGGASSNARVGSPIAINRGMGAELIDLDGNRYIDYILGFGPILLGHAHNGVTKAVYEAMIRGTTFAFSQDLELSVAEQIVSLCPSIDMVRLCNSGSDAAITAYRVACAHTKASMAIKIEGDYHGNADVLLHDIPGVDANDLDTRTTPGSTGLPACIHDLIVTICFNDVDALESALKNHRGKIAAVFMEPILGNTAAIMPKPGYLRAVRSLCDDYGVVLVFDEVKTGFRVGLGGAQEYFGVHSDLTMYGKSLANGLPLAALGGKRELMQLIKPGGVHHCGTYFGNLPCTAGAKAVLSILSSIDYSPLMQRGERLAKGICSLLDNASIPAHWQGLGSMFGITIGIEQPRDYRTWWLRTERKLWMDITTQLREFGVLTDGFIGLFFLSFAHTDEQIDKTLSACEDVIKRFKH